MVAGVALFDYDNDGWLDIYAVNGARMPGLEKTGPSTGTASSGTTATARFTDVTERQACAGRGYDLGVATGDYDNDGDTDLFVAGLRRNTLYHNNGDGTFTDVTEKSRARAAAMPKYGTLWAVAAAFFDYDNDGRLDLFVSNYCVWDPETEPLCGNPEAPDYCHPKDYQGLPNSLFHNNGDGTFTDVSAASGIRAHVGKGMGIGVADFDDDGWTGPVRRQRHGARLPVHEQPQRHASRRAPSSARWRSPSAREAVSGMGADARDVDNDGLPDIFETALANETFPLFKNLGRGDLRGHHQPARASAAPRAPRSGLGQRHRRPQQRRLEGPVRGLRRRHGSARAPSGSACPMANAVFVNLGNGRFADGSAAAGAAFARKAVHRGAAFGDLDNDGRVDVVVTRPRRPPRALAQRVAGARHWLLVKTVGGKSNRDGMGAKIKIVTASGTQYNHVNTAVGYGCASDRRVHFGLGADTVVKELTIAWPSGKTQTLNGVKADQVLTVREPE